MRHLFAIVLAAFLWVGIAPMAHADYYSNLTPCGENAEFLDLAEEAETPAAQARFEKYSTLLCGEDGLPHLNVDGNLGHLSEFVVPGVMFLYIAGWIGWVGRSYLQAIKADKKPEDKEIVIDVPLAVKCSLSGFAWPLAAFGEFSSGKMFADESEVTVSPR